MKTRWIHSILKCMLVVLLWLSYSYSEAVGDQADLQMVNRIWEQGTTHSQVMQTLSYLTDVIGPRIPGSPAMKKAYNWTSQKLKEWGLQNVVIESCGEFGFGWSNEYISAHMIEPSYMPILAYPKPWSLGTKGKIAGRPIMAILKTI